MEPIFAQLSLEYFKDGKSLPWNKVANPEIISINPAYRSMPHFLVSRDGRVVGIKADLSKAKSQYFNL